MSDEEIQMSDESSNDTSNGTSSRKNSYYRETQKQIRRKWTRRRRRSGVTRSENTGNEGVKTGNEGVKMDRGNKHMVETLAAILAVLFLALTIFLLTVAAKRMAAAQDYERAQIAQSQKNPWGKFTLRVSQ